MRTLFAVSPDAGFFHQVSRYFKPILAHLIPVFLQDNVNLFLKYGYCSKCSPFEHVKGDRKLSVSNTCVQCSTVPGGWNSWPGTYFNLSALYISWGFFFGDKWIIFSWLKFILTDYARFLLKNWLLLSKFCDWNILFYDPGWPVSRRVDIKFLKVCTTGKILTTILCLWRNCK